MRRKKEEITEEQEKIMIRKKGQREGIKVGQKIGIMQVARNMLRAKMNIMVVKDLTGLTEEELKKINLKK
ncbi:MAG: hypothetical protein EGQ16_02635 [Clostridiales bacterium]|nr:hypothetical protein [Clostridiales bacterium]